jgi:hypothetical protein
MTAHQGEEAEPLEQGPSPEHVHTRASGRPPEEATSDDPEAQAEVVLTESEQRVADRAEHEA